MTSMTSEYLLFSGIVTQFYNDSTCNLEVDTLQLKDEEPESGVQATNMRVEMYRCYTDKQDAVDGWKREEFRSNRNRWKS